MNAEDLGYETCPEHGDSLAHAEDVGYCDPDEYEQREHLVCTERGCDYEAWS